jgi:hypothetical protein
MKALSIRPPWAYYIIQGIPYGVSVDNGDGTTSVKDSGKVLLKDVENRSWALPSGFTLPQRIMVHVGKREDDIDHVMAFCVGVLKLPIFSILASYSKLLPRGAIIGEVDIVGCKFRDPDENANLYSPWHEPGMYGFLLENPLLYDKPIPYKGRLGLFEVKL